LEKQIFGDEELCVEANSRSYRNLKSVSCNG